MGKTESLSDRIELFAKCGRFMRNLSSGKAISDCGITNNYWHKLLDKVCAKHPFFTPQSINYATKVWGNMLTESNLYNWCDMEEVNDFKFKAAKIALIMPGNIPWVGFHDFLIAVLLGFKLDIKPSSKDPYLWQFLLELIPEFKEKVSISEGVKSGFDAIIATGSNNTFRYFDYYFKKYPHILRGHRSSCAILSGKETKEELSGLWNDISLYYGMGCRNVSKLYVPENWDWTLFFEIGKGVAEDYMLNCKAYRDNYSYLRVVQALDKLEFIDSGFMLFRECNLQNPHIGEVFYQKYSDINLAIEDIRAIGLDNWQCIVGSKALVEAKGLNFLDLDAGRQYVSIGETQSPGLSDYADGISIPAFLKRNFAI